MGDIYDLEKASQKKKEISQEDQDNSILNEAKRIEEQNYEQARDIRLQLEQASLEQKGATEEMKRQGETLSGAKRSAVNIHKEARRGEELADDIEREGSIFSCGLTSCFKNLFKWFRHDPGDDVVDEIRNKEEEEITREEVEKVEFKETDEFVPGQNKTDKELYGVLNTVRGIKAEAELQSKEANKQKSTIHDIGKVNEQSEKVIKRTDKHLKEIE